MRSDPSRRKRGRPAHPDILTPREWQVLDLIRQDLTNEQIAQRLDISPATAKYQVSEIISKLGVQTREEAAAWQPEAIAVRWWERATAPLAAILRRLGPPTLMKAAIAAGVLAALGVLLGWVAFVSDESPEEGHTGVSGQLPESPGLLTIDQVLVHSGRGAQTPVEEAQVTLTTYAGAIDEISDRGYGEPAKCSETPQPG